MVRQDKADHTFQTLFLERCGSNSEYVCIVLNLRFSFWCLRDVFIDDGILSLCVHNCRQHRKVLLSGAAEMTRHIVQTGR